jgi:hypothetical protein
MTFDWDTAELEATVWVGSTAVERWTDGAMIAIVDDDERTEVSYSEGETLWADVLHDAAYPYSDR